MCRYVPVVLAQAKILWDRGDYTALGHLLERSAEFGSDHETWTLNAAHVLFMQAGKYKEAAELYQSVVHKHIDNVSFSFSLSSSVVVSGTVPSVGRQEGRPRPENNRVVGCWRGCLSAARCRLANGPADATATHCLLLQ